MQFIGTGNRILTENFTIGYLYTITFRAGYYINSACIGKGADNVMFQRTEPELLFSLNMDTAPDVYSIELYSGGGGTDDYETLSNKPQINSVTLSGDKSSSELGLQSNISDLDTIRAGAAAGATAVQPAALSDYQPVISDLDTIRAGAAAGATAVQPAALSDYQPNIDSTHMLSSDLVDDTSATHKFATAEELQQIKINKNNILCNTQYGVKNLLKIPNDTYTVSGLTVTAVDGLLTFTSTNATTHAIVIGTITLAAGTYMCSDRAAGSKGFDLRIMIDGINVTTTAENAEFTLQSDKTAEIRVYSYATITNQTIKPMLCLKSLYDADNTYQPFAMSNAELTAAVQAIQAALANQ